MASFTLNGVVITARTGFVYVARGRGEERVQILYFFASD